MMTRSYFTRFRTFAIMLVACTALSACLPEDKDPAKQAAAETGKMNGAYYAAALGNTALKIQNAVVSDSTWFEQMNDGRTLDLASMDITNQGVPAEIKSQVCPTGAGTEVMQITWIDGRDDHGKFSLKGIGVDNAMIMSSLRSRVAADQLGILTSGRNIALTNNQSEQIPTTCADIDIPQNAPVVLFKISRPAPPVTEMRRTEYRSLPCDDTGKLTGTKVEKRIVLYKTNGEIVAGTWDPDNLGECLETVNVAAVTTGTTKSLSNTLNTFADLALRNMLSDNMSGQACKTSTVTDADTGKIKTINTCGAEGTRNSVAQITDNSPTSVDETTSMSCTGSGPVKRVIPGLKEEVTSTVAFTGGTATLVRKRETSTTNLDPSGKVKIGQWMGNSIACTGNETASIACTNLSSAPILASPDKWRTDITGGAMNYNTSLSNAQCGSYTCSTSPNLTVTYLNPAFFVGGVPSKTGGLTLSSNVTANEWADKALFKPKVTGTSNFSISNNQCEWIGRSLGNCPAASSATGGSWNSGTIGFGDAFPATYDNTAPTLHMPPSPSAEILAMAQSTINEYNASRAAGRIVSYVSRYYAQRLSNGSTVSQAVHYGSGTELYLKSWQSGVRSPPSGVPLNGTAMYYRDQMCASGYAYGGYATLCNDKRSYLDGTQQYLTRSLCGMPDRAQSNGFGNYVPPVSGWLQYYCEYITDQVVYDLGTNRQWRYPWRGMARPGTRYEQVTLLNKNGSEIYLTPAVAPDGASLFMNQSVKTPMHCVRAEEEEVEIPLYVKYRSFYSAWANYPPLRGGTGVERRNDCYGIMIYGACIGVTITLEFHTVTSSAMFRKTIVQEYTSTSGWSYPRSAYISNWLGTYSSLPSYIWQDLSAGCDGNDGMCDGRNEWFGGHP